MPFACARGPGHPDEACDRVAAALAEEYVRRDPEAITDIRVVAGHGALFVVGEIQSSADFDVAAVARRALGSIDPTLDFEPFVSIERMRAPSSLGTAEALTVFGYACDENPSHLPAAVFQARRIAEEIERLRKEDADWFWCGADYDVAVTHGLSRPFASVRFGHAVVASLTEIRSKAAAALSSVAPDLDWRINPAGADTRGGLAGRSGSSGQLVPGGGYGSALPSNPSGTGRSPSHPFNRGAELARIACRELVDGGKGHAVWIELLYPSLERKPSILRARNERGEDVSADLDPSRFSI